MESRFCLKQLTESEVDSIMAFQKEIIEGLTDKTLLRKNTREMFQQCVRKPNYTLGVYEGEVWAALGILFDGSGTEEDLSVGLTKFQVKNYTVKEKRLYFFTQSFTHYIVFYTLILFSIIILIINAV